MYKIKADSKGLVSHGVNACAGCALELIMRNTMDVLGEDTIIVIPPGCSAMFSGYGKETALKIAGIQGTLEATAAFCTGIKRGLIAQGNTHTTVLGFAGDGGTVDIGIQSLSGMFERGEKVIYICYDNEAYMNTGIQGSSSTPLGASTTTTPSGKPTRRKDLVGIAIAHDIHYAATATIAYLPDLRKKVKKAKEADGPALLHVHSPCSTGWRYDPAKTIEIARAAVETGCWILYEYENGKRIANRVIKELKPVEAYIGVQGRFKHLKEQDIEELQSQVRDHYNKFMAEVNK